MPSRSPGSPPASFLERALGTSSAEFAALSPGERAARATSAVPDLHAFLDEGRPFAERDEPARTRELAEGLLAALGDLRRPAAEHDAGRAARIVTDGLLRSECDRDQNVYLGKLFTHHLTNSVPDLVFQPTSAAEVAAALRWARSGKVPVTLRGAATTAMGGAIPGDGGLVLDLSRLDEIEIDDKGDRVWIGAGTRMRSLHAALAEAELALPVYPSNLGGTFAGWLATGGIGMNAFGRGRALDALHAAEVVLPTGEVLRLAAEGGLAVRKDHETTIISAEDRAAWFEEHGLQVLELSDLAGSEGQFGVLTRLCLAVERLPDLAAFLLGFERREDALDAVDWVRGAAEDGLLDPADVKLLSGSHVHHAAKVWAEEDGKSWRDLPGAYSSDAGLPWARMLGPAELGAETHADPHGAAYVFVDFLGEEEGRAFAARLGQCPGAPRVLGAESVRFARDRFRPQQMKRMGPGLLAAEIQLPAHQVAGFLPAAERLAQRAAQDFDAEVYYLSDGSALALAGYLCDHRRGAFRVDLLLAPALLDLAMARFEGTPYVLGRWQANLFKRKFGPTRARQLEEQKQRVDPERIVNRGAFFEMGMKGPVGAGLRLVMGPSVRVLRILHGVPGVTPLLRGLANLLPGPASGRGERSGEVVVDDRKRASARALTCVNCGECNAVCPIFHESKIRLPQMLTHLGEAAYAGEELGASGSALLDLCMRCGNCEEVCQAGIPHLPVYEELQRVSDDERPRDKDRHVLLLERLRSSRTYLNEFLGAREGGYIKRVPASLPGSARFLLLRAEQEAGPAATCIHCGACVDVCPTSANEEYQGDDPRWITTVQEKCIGCGTCVEVCPANHQNGGQTLRVMEAPTFDLFAAMEEFAATETSREKA